MSRAKVVMRVPTSLREARTIVGVARSATARRTLRPCPACLRPAAAIACRAHEALIGAHLRRICAS